MEHKRQRLLASVLVLAALVTACSDPGTGSSDDDDDAATYTIVINEFMVDNHSSTGILDAYGEADDWVELYNTGTAAVNLGDLYMSDDPSEPTKSRLPDTLIQPGAYYVAWGGDDNMGFGFSTDRTKAEEIVLATAGGTLVDGFAYLQKVEAYVEGRSYGRNPDGGDAWKQQVSPTPGSANGN